MSGMITVTTAAELYTALLAAKGGEILFLEAGHYGCLCLNRQTHPGLDYETPVTLTGVAAPLPAVFSGLHLSGVTNLVFEGILFDVAAPCQTPVVEESSGAPFKLVTCGNITFQGCIFRGSSEGAGRQISCGLTLSACQQITIDTCRISAFSHGIMALSSEGLTVTRCELHGLNMDGMLLIDMKSVQLEKNHLHDFVFPMAPHLPMTMLHLRTKQAGRAHCDIVMRGNILDIAKGTATRGIVVCTDAGLQSTLCCEGLVIEDNLILTSHCDGIAIGTAKTVTVRHNSVLRARCDRVGTGDTDVSPLITIAPDAAGVTLHQNAAFAIVGPCATAPQADWSVKKNAFVQTENPDLPGWYGDVFEPEPAGFSGSRDLFVPRKDSMLYHLGAGLQPTQDTLDATVMAQSTPPQADAAAGEIAAPIAIETGSKVTQVHRLMPPRLLQKQRFKTLKSLPKRPPAAIVMPWSGNGVLDCSAPLM
jgi:hypothetical protein